MIPYPLSYRPFGQPAFAYVDIVTVPAAGDKITINGTDYTFGTHFFGTGRTKFSITQNLAEAIRGEPNGDGHIIRNPLSVVTAMAYGSITGQAMGRLFLFATEPGTAGNALTLTTNNSAVFVVSGATFSGGTDAVAGNSTVVNAGQVKQTTSTYSPTRFQNLGANATLNVKVTAGNVFALTCYNANASARYLQLHNSATVSSGAPLYSFLVPPASQIIVGTDFFTNEGANFSTGIAFGFSTARDTYTAGTNTDQTTVIHYK